MSTPNPYTKYATDAAPAEADNPYAKYASANPAGAADAPTPKRSLWTAINDTVIEGANAAAGTASAVANFVRPGNVASQWIDKNIVEAGEAAQSDVVKAEKARYSQEMQDADGMGGEVGATLGYVARNPLLAAAQAAGSFATPGLAIKGATTGARALGLGTKGTTRAGLAAGAGIGAAGAGGDAAGTAYELSREGGATDEQAVAAARGASVIPGAIGAVGGLVGAERLVAGAGGFKGGLVSRALKTAGVEGAQEAVEEGVTQYEGQRAAVPFNPDLDPMKGVAGAATMGGVLGAATGAGTSLLTRDSQAPVRKPSEDLGLDPSNGPLSKAAAAAVDEGRAAAPMQPEQAAQPEDGLSLQPVEQPEAPATPSMAERLEALPQQARAQADQLLREIADERTPEGVKRFRANELQQLLDANPMPQVPSMDISQEDRIAMGPIVRGFDPSTGQAPARPLELADAQPQYEGGIDFEQQPQAEPSSLIQLAEWYERSAQGNRDAANPVGQIQQQVRQGTQYTDAAPMQGQSTSQVGGGDSTTMPNGIRRGVQSPTNQTAEQSAAYDGWLRSIDAVQDGTVYEDPATGETYTARVTQPGVDKRGKSRGKGVSLLDADGAPAFVLASNGEAGKDAGYFGASINGLNGPAWTVSKQPTNQTGPSAATQGAQRNGAQTPQAQQASTQQPAAGAAAGQAVNRVPAATAAQAAGTAAKQGAVNGGTTTGNNGAQASEQGQPQSQAPAPAFPQPAGVADATQATQAQQAGAQPQAPGAAVAEGSGQAAPAKSTPVERKRSAGDLARSRSYAANPMRAFLAKHGVNLDSRSEFAPGLQEIRGTLVPGYGPMFRKSGKPLDTLVQNAVEEGFLPEGATEADLYDLIDRAVRRGERVAPMYTESAAESEFEAMAARQAEFAREDYEADRAAQDAEAAEYDAVLAQKYAGMTDEEFAALEAGVPDLNAGSNMSTEDAMRALGFSEKEIQDAITQKQGVAPEGGQRTGRAVEADTRGAQARTGASQGDALQSYTEAELKQRQEAQEKAEAEAAKAEREAAAKEKAERERKEISARQAASAENFELGQDPMASLSGQTSIFDAPPQPVVQAAPAQPQQAQDAAEINAEARQGNAAMFSRTERPAVSNTTAVQMRRAMVQRTVGSLTQRWGQNPRITVVDSMNDPRVPEAVREADQAQRSQGATGEPEGFWYQGQVYLVASALPTSADATRVLYHEVLGHHGLRGRFGAELDKVLDQVAKLRPKDVAAKASEYGLDMGNPDHVANAAEEVLAELAQTRPDLGFVQRAIAAIRNFLRSHVPGFKALELTDADIVQGYLLPARGWVERSGQVEGRSKAPGTKDFESISDQIVPSYARSDTGEEVSVRKTDGGGNSKKQSPDGSGSTGLQLPSENRTTQGLQVRNVATQADAVNDAPPGHAMFSRSQPADAIRSSMGSLTADQERKASWAAPSASQWDDLTYKLQDKHIDTKRVLESIRATGKAIGDDLDVYLQEELYHGRAAKRTEDFVAQELEPLVRYMSGAGLKMPELEEFLHARHAKEANAVIAKRNPDLPDGGSGMTNAEADAVMAAYSPTKRSLLGKAAEKVDAIIAQTRQTFVEYGLESQDTVDAWGQTFAHYVPLMREQEGDGMAGLGTGQGFSVKGKEVKGRTGSTKKVVDILANIAMQRERAIVRGEKNRVAAALVGLAKANPSGFWKVDVVPTRQVLGKDGMVKTEHDPLYKQRDNVVVAKIPEVDAKTGKVVVKEHAVLFDENDARALRMAQSLKNLDAAQLEGMLGATAKVTRYLAAINTQYNPIFGVTNLVRDLQGAAVNLQSTELAGRHGEVLAQSLPALRGIYSEMRAQRKGETTGTPWSQLWEEFQGVGGQTGYRDQFRTSADRGEAIEKALDPGSWADSGLGKLFTANGALKVPMEFARQKAQWLFQWLDDYNTAMENGVRLAAYKAGLDAGLSKERAASIAKNLTTNFNRKGQVAQQVGALYAFFNASMQGTARIGQALFTMEPGKPKTMRLSPLGKKVVFGGVTLGVMQALLLAAAGFDEGEPQEFVRELNLIIPVGGKKYITIPMPLGLHVLPNLGRIPAEFAMGGFQNPSATAIKVMSLFADAFNPMGSAGLSMQTLVPTVLDPLAALAENKDFSGRSIAKESFNQATPGHALGRDSASALATWVAQAINFLSGGTQYVRGEFSPTPDQIEYLVGQATGGVGRELLKLQSTAKGLMDGDEVPPHKVPLLGRFYGDSDTPSAKQATFYSHMDSVRRHAEQVKGLRLDGNASEALAYAASHPEARLAFAARKASQDVQKMRELRRELELQGASKEAIRNIDQRMVQRMELFNELVGRTVGAS
ncbi:LPD38 domain-containing protein [Comamonas aquatica]|uniref:LPD38 domain-containing protein n=1 Tax=Comamonas aquatica TaxID=225991 RepID=UPI0034D783AD